MVPGIVRQFAPLGTDTATPLLCRLLDPPGTGCGIGSIHKGKEWPVRLSP
jgi:hypothetical protein